MAEFTGLILPSDELRDSVDSSVRVQAFKPEDVPDWEKRLLDPANDPTAHLEKKRQRRNDCQGNAIANCLTKILWTITGDATELSDTAAYQLCEWIDNRGRVGMDRGTSIQSGVTLITKGIEGVTEPGLPTEADWPYETYTSNAAQVKARAQKCTNVGQDVIVEHFAAPDFRTALIVMALGGAIHWGTYWGLQWDGRRVVRKYVGKHGGGGHATAIVHAIRLASGEWLLVVLNSHGDGVFFVDETAYEEMRSKRYSPYGAYALLPDKPIERFYARQFDLMA